MVWKAGIARRADVHHRRELVLHELLVDRIPGAVRQRRRGPLAAGGIGVEVHRHGPELFHGAREFRDARLGGGAGGLGQHRAHEEAVRVQLADPRAEVVAQARPGLADREVADVMGHERGARAEDRHVAPPLVHELELVRFDRLADVVIADLQGCRVRRLIPALRERDLEVAPRAQLRRSGRVVAVDVDDQRESSSLKDRGGRCSATGAVAEDAAAYDDRPH